MPVDPVTYVDLTISRQIPVQFTGAGADGFFSEFARATYDFTVQGGAISTILLPCQLPPNTIVVDGFLDVVAAITGAGASCALQIEAAGDLLATTAVGTMGTLGRHALIPTGTAANTVKTTLQRTLALVVSGGALTAGRMIVWLHTLPGSL